MSQAGKPIFKAVLFWGAFWLLLFGLQILPLATVPDWTSLLWGSLLAGCSVLLVVLFLRSEHQRLRDIGLTWESGSLRRLILGTFSGMIVVGLMLITMSSFSSIHFDLVSSPD